VISPKEAYGLRKLIKKSTIYKTAIGTDLPKRLDNLKQFTQRCILAPPLCKTDPKVASRILVWAFKVILIWTSEVLLLFFSSFYKSLRCLIYSLCFFFNLLLPSSLLWRMLTPSSPLLFMKRFSVVFALGHCVQTKTAGGGSSLAHSLQEFIATFFKTLYCFHIYCVNYVKMQQLLLCSAVKNVCSGFSCVRFFQVYLTVAYWGAKTGLFMKIPWKLGLNNWGLPYFGQTMFTVSLARTWVICWVW